MLKIKKKSFLSDISEVDVKKKKKEKLVTNKVPRPQKSECSQGMGDATKNLKLCPTVYCIKHAAAFTNDITNHRDE